MCLCPQPTLARIEAQLFYGYFYWIIILFYFFLLDLYAFNYILLLSFPLWRIRKKLGQGKWMKNRLDMLRNTNSFPWFALCVV